MPPASLFLSQKNKKTKKRKTKKKRNETKTVWKKKKKRFRGSVVILFPLPPENKKGVLLPGANRETLGGPRGGGRGSGSLPEHTQVSQGLRPVRAEERGDLHTGDRQAHARGERHDENMR